MSEWRRTLPRLDETILPSFARTGDCSMSLARWWEDAAVQFKVRGDAAAAATAASNAEHFSRLAAMALPAAKGAN